MSDLLNKADDWLKPHGCSIFHKSADNKWANYVNMDRRAVIEVFIKNDVMMCRGHSFLGRTMITVRSPDFTLENKNLFKQLDIIDDACLAYEECQDYQ